MATLKKSKKLTPYELADIGRKIAYREASILWLLKHDWWESYNGQTDEEIEQDLCEMTELWGIIEDEERNIKK